VSAQSPTCPWCNAPTTPGQAFGAPAPRRWSTSAIVAAGVAVLLVVASSGFVTLRALHRDATTGRATAALPGQLTTSAPNAASSPSSPALPVGSAISSGQALRFVSAWYRARDAARFVNDDAALAELETGAALSVDQAFTQRIACGCEEAKHRHQVDETWVVLPRAPVHAFLAQLVVTRVDNGQRGVYTVVFRPSGRTWKAAVITLDDAYTKAFLPPADLAHAPPTDRATKTELTALGTYLQAWRTTGAAPKAVAAWSGVAPLVGADQAAHGQDRTDPRTHVRTHFVTPVPTGPVYAFSVSGGSIACGAMLSTAEDTGTRGVLFQDEARRNWGAQLAPGLYPRLVEQFEDEVCVINHDGGPRELTAFYGTTTAIGPPVG
jgi:hypothetical protein